MHIRSLNRIALTLIIIFGFFSAYITHLVFSTNNTSLYQDNALIENIQAILIALSATTYLSAALLSKQKNIPILLFCALLCYAFFLRELDLEKMNVPHIIQIAGSGIGRNTSILLALTTLVAYSILKNFNLNKKLTVNFFKDRSGMLLIAAGVILILSSLFEKQFIFLHHVFFEEILELVAYLIILISAIFSLSYGVGNSNSVDKKKTLGTPKYFNCILLSIFTHSNPKSASMTSQADSILSSIFP